MADFLPILLANAAAIVLSANYFLQRHALQSIDPIKAAFLSVFATTVMFWLLAPFTVEPGWFTHPAIRFFVIAGLVFPAMGQFLQMQAVKRVGPTLTALLANFTPIFAATLAIIYLDESLTSRMAIGFCMILGGVAMAGRVVPRQSRSFPLWALLLPLGASAARGIGQPTSKLGLLDIPSPVFATLIMGSVSLCVLFVIVGLSGRAPQLRHFGKGESWVLLVGMINGLGILLINAAVALGDITVVSPFLATMPIWVLLMNWAIFKAERLYWRHGVMALLVVSGAVLLAVR